METKKEFRIFTIVNHKEEEQYLRQQHNAGWKFIKVTGIGTYCFEKCQPEDVVYQLDYNREASSDKAEYLGMFADCGWDYIQEFFGYSYFRKRAADMNGEEEIFCDDSSRLAMMERVFKGRLVPLLGIFFAVLLPQFLSNLSGGNYGIALFLGSFLALYIVIFVYFAIRYYQQKK
jgi:hypothetical protein